MKECSYTYVCGMIKCGSDSRTNSRKGADTSRYLLLPWLPFHLTFLFVIGDLNSPFLDRVR
jgi:hypothetical protein